MEKETYRIQYVDNTYQLVEWTIDHLALVYKDMSENKPIIMVDKCIFRTNDIRAIVHLEQEPEQPKEDEVLVDEEGMVVTEMGTYEKEIYDLLVAQGIDVGNVIGERRNK